MKDTTQLPLFKDFDGYSPKYHFFKNSLLGKVHDPFHGMAWYHVYQKNVQGQVPKLVWR